MSRLLASIALLAAVSCGSTTGQQSEMPPLRDAPEDPQAIDAGPEAAVADANSDRWKRDIPDLPEEAQKGAPEGALSTPKGVKYVVIEKGTGSQKPLSTDKATVHYTGWTTDGKMFDSSHVRGEAANFPVGALIPGWVDVLQQMVVGDHWRVWIPEELAYKGAAGAPQGMLIFDMELLEIE